MTSEDLFAYLDLGTFSLDFPDVFVCGSGFNYQVDNFELKDGSNNDVLLPPLSHDSSGINYDADHVLAAVQQTVLHATIYDYTTNAPDVIDITFSFVLHVEDGNQPPFVVTNDCLDVHVEQDAYVPCDFQFDDPNAQDTLTYTFSGGFDVLYVHEESGILQVNPGTDVPPGVYTV